MDDRLEKIEDMKDVKKVEKTGKIHLPKEILERYNTNFFKVVAEEGYIKLVPVDLYAKTKESSKE